MSRKKRASEAKVVRSGGFITNPIYVQIIYPLLDLLTQRREQISDATNRMAVNGGIILYSAIFLEGFLEDFLCTFIPHYADGTGGKTPALMDIERTSSLDDYKRLFRGFGLHLRDFLNDREQEDLDFIFRYRNLLAHGQRDSYVIFHEADFVPQGIDGSHYAAIEQFLVKRRLLPKSKSVQPDHRGLFSDPVADWVFDRAKAIVTKMTTELERRLPYYQMSFHANALRLSQLMQMIAQRASLHKDP